MRHGITISDRDKEEILGFFARGVDDGQPLSWFSWVVHDTPTEGATKIIVKGQVGQRRSGEYMTS